MKKLSKMRMVRAADVFLPGAFLLTSLLGKGTVTDNLFMTAYIARLLGLASARGLRQAFSLQPSLKKVRGSVIVALLLQLVGVAVLLLADFVQNHVVVPTHFIYAAIALLLNVEHVFYEYLYATGDGYSALLCRSITAALVGGGVLMTSVSSHDGLLPYCLEWPLGGACLAAAVAGVISFMIGGPLKGKLNDQVIKCAPLALLQSLVYPLFHLALSLISNSALQTASTSASFFAGLALYELCRAPFRRAAMESREMNRNLLIVCAASMAVIGLCVLPLTGNLLRGVLGRRFVDLPAAAVSLIAASACAFGMYGRIG